MNDKLLMHQYVSREATLISIHQTEKTLENELLYCARILKSYFKISDKENSSMFHVKHCTPCYLHR